MKDLHHPASSWRARSGFAAGAFVASLVSLGSIVLLFASASGELGPVVARFKAAPAASGAMAGEPVRKPAPG